MGKTRFSPEGRQERNLLEDMARRRLIRHKRQLQMVDNPFHDGMLRDEGDDLHPAPALGADHNNRICRMGFLPFGEQFSEKPFHAHIMRRNFQNFKRFG